MLPMHVMSCSWHISSVTVVHTFNLYSDGDTVDTENYILRSLRTKLAKRKFRNQRREKQKRKNGMMVILLCSNNPLLSLLYRHLQNVAMLVIFLQDIGCLNFVNRPFARSGHMVQNKLHWDASYAVGFPKQRNWYQSSKTFLCIESPTA